MLEINLTEIKRIIKDISKTANMKCVLYDERFRVIYSYPHTMHPFCSVVRENEDMSRRCLMCDNIGRENTVKENQRYIYKCHMGLTECIAPIVKGGNVIGFLMVGQVIGENDIQHIKDCISKFPDGEAREKLTRALELSTPVSRGTIESTANIVDMCTSYLWLKELISIKGDTQGFALTEYINSHLADDLSVEHLCHKFSMSKTALYLLSKETFGTGVTDYIRKKRLEMAENLLKNESHSISTVAQLCGFLDSNYFIKVFKRHKGITPNQLRLKK